MSAADPSATELPTHCSSPSRCPDASTATTSCSSTDLITRMALAESDLQRNFESSLRSQPHATLRQLLPTLPPLSDSVLQLVLDTFSRAQRSVSNTQDIRRWCVPVTPPRASGPGQPPVCPGAPIRPSHSRTSDYDLEQAHIRQRLYEHSIEMEKRGHGADMLEVWARCTHGRDIYMLFDGSTLASCGMC